MEEQIPQNVKEISERVLAALHAPHPLESQVANPAEFLSAKKTDFSSNAEATALLNIIEDHLNHR